MTRLSATVVPDAIAARVLATLRLGDEAAARLNGGGGVLPPEYVELLADLETVARAQRVRVPDFRRDGNAEAPSTEMGAPSEGGQRLTPREVAQRLCITESRSRQLIRGGVLDARRDGRRWLVDPVSFAEVQAARKVAR